MKTPDLKQKQVVSILVAFLLVFAIQDVNFAQGRGKIYWTETAWNWESKLGKIRCANLNGSAAEDIVTGLSGPVDIALDLLNHKMYWVDRTTAKIQRANLDGTDVEDIVVGFMFPPGPGKLNISCFKRKCKGIAFPNGEKPVELPHELLIDPRCVTIDVPSNKVYWGNWHLEFIQRANLDGSNVEDLNNTKQWISPMNIELDIKAGKIYWADLSGAKIARSNLDGSGTEDLIPEIRGPNGLALDLRSRQMYWTNMSTGKIQRAYLNGNKVEDLVTGLSYPSGIVLDLRSRKMYWVDWDWDTSTGKIQRANLDGSNVTDILTGLNRPSGIALDTIGIYDVAPNINKLTTTWANMKIQ